jgi:multicomponent Na+:H+ antiporter subunit F
MSLIYLFILLLVVAAMGGFYRLLAGPTRADRVIAFDLLFAVAVVLCICASLASGSTAFLDVAIGLSLVGFVATIAWARLIDRQVSSGEQNE